MDSPARSNGRAPGVWWFGPTWDSPINETCPQVAAPVGAACLFCQQPITDGQRGLLLLQAPDTPERSPGHLDCFLRAVVPPPWSQAWLAQTYATFEILPGRVPAIQCRLCGRISDAEAEVTERRCARCRLTHTAVGEARRLHRDGATHECSEWRTFRNTCAVCGRPL